MKIDGRKLRDNLEKQLESFEEKWERERERKRENTNANRNEQNCKWNSNRELLFLEYDQREDLGRRKNERKKEKNKDREL